MTIAWVPFREIEVGGRFRLIYDPHWFRRPRTSHQIYTKISPGRFRDDQGQEFPADLKQAVAIEPSEH